MNDVIIKQEVIHNRIPILLCYTAQGREKHPIVLYHAFLETKEFMLSFAYKFAQMGYLAVCCDLDRHGERENYRPKFPWQYFYDVVFQTAGEIPAVIDFLTERANIRPGQMTVFGVSLGGLTALAASIVEPRVTNIATILASGDFPELAKVEKTTNLRRFFSDNTYNREEFLKHVDELSLIYDPGQNIDKVYPKKILMINGMVDMAIPFTTVKGFQAKLAEKYRNCPEKLKFIHMAGTGHQLNADMFGQALGWMKENQ